MTEVPTFDVEEIFGDADARQAHRYRLAWMSARQRAANHFDALVDSDDQRDQQEEVLELIKQERDEARAEVVRLGKELEARNA